jgi:hypothetical protein
MRLRDVTKVVLMLPVPWLLVVGTVQLRAGDMAGFQQLATGFAAVYTPALTAFVTGTSIKRAQERKGAQ